MSAKIKIISYEEAANDSLFCAYVKKTKKTSLLNFLKESSCIADLKGSRVVFNRFTFLGNPMIVYYNIEGHNNDFVVKFLSDFYIKNNRHFIEIIFDEWKVLTDSKMMYTDGSNQPRFFKYDYES